MSAKERSALNPAPRELLDRLPQVEFDPARLQGEQGTQRADLLRSALQVARMDAVSEAALVRESVTNALGALPSANE
jgi:hypothetical protein